VAVADQPVPGSGAAEEIAAMIPAVQLVADAAMELQRKFWQCSCSLTSSELRMDQLTQELQDSKSENDRLQQDHTTQLQTFHHALQTVNSEITAAKNSAHVCTL